MIESRLPETVMTDKNYRVLLGPLEKNWRVGEAPQLLSLAG